MNDMILIDIVIDDETKTVSEDKGIKLYELANKYYGERDGYKAILARVDDVGRDLLYELNRSCRVEFLDLRCRLARLAYQKTIIFLYLIVLNELKPEVKAMVQYPLNGGIFIEFDSKIPGTKEFAFRIEKRMRELISENIMFQRRIISRSEILSENPPESITKQQIDFIRNCDVQEVFEYSYNGFSAVFYDHLMQSAGALTIFEIVPYNGNIIIRVPQHESPNNINIYRDDVKMFQTYGELAHWKNFIDLNYISDLNKKIENGEWHDLILINEALHEKNIAEIADKIVKNNKRIILIAGPSSSGKTTFAQRLCIQLRVNGKKPLYMGTDDYFIERDQMSRNERGKFDFEDLSAVDVDLFNNQMNALLRGEIVDMPVFDFITGSKRYGTRITKADANQPIVIEGIHALNKALTSHIDDSEKFRIYISPLTALNIDEINRIPVTDVRLIRRIVRDMRSRNKTAQQTLEQWDDVRDGEIKNIFPYNVEADVVFNSVLMYELAVLKPFAEKGLSIIEKGEPEYLEAQRLLRILSCVKSLDGINDISNNSIIREFIGGGIWVK
ncbi:MAG: nucleoside kinase [Firmicutes bacterium]|nr:nucleoside kinase [Bacillota bacterium]